MDARPATYAAAAAINVAIRDATDTDTRTAAITATYAVTAGDPELTADAIDDAVYANCGAVTYSAAYIATETATRNATTAATAAATSNATYEAIDEAIYDATRDATRVATRMVRDAMRSSITEATDPAIRNTIYEASSVVGNADVTYTAMAAEILRR